MLKIEKTVLPSPEQWEIIIEGMRNPLNSWHLSDSYKTHIENEETLNTADFEFFLGEKDRDLMMRLAKAGTYKVGTVANSCSTMHKIHAKPFRLDDFSHEHLTDVSMGVLCYTIDNLNNCRELFLVDKNKEWWWQMIQLLPSSYNQRRTVQLNYAVLKNMYHSRKNHKLDEWREFCKWIEELPHSYLIVGDNNAE